MSFSSFQQFVFEKTKGHDNLNNYANRKSDLTNLLGIESRLYLEKIKSKISQDL